MAAVTASVWGPSDDPPRATALEEVGAEKTLAGSLGPNSIGEITDTASPPPPESSGPLSFSARSMSSRVTQALQAATLVDD